MPSIYGMIEHWLYSLAVRQLRSLNIELVAMKQKIYIVIPARYQSTRFPGKPLVKIAGHSMLERVWRIAKCSQYADNLIIATDDERIQQHALSFQANVMMTPESCRNGTERVYAAVKEFAVGEDIVLSLQGDAVLTPPWVIDNLIESLHNDPSYAIATPAQALTDKAIDIFLEHKQTSPSTGTTVAFDINHKALYFSKQVIPYAHGKPSLLHRHIGLYAYRYHALEKLQSLPPSPLEKIEKLEQLRALENNMSIKISVVDYKGRTHASVDTPEDITLVEKLIREEGELVL